MKNEIIEMALRDYNTPFYLYDKLKIIENKRKLNDCIGKSAQLFYSMKANPNPYICSILAREGCGVEVASAGELKIALQSGFHRKKIIFSGPGKSRNELEYAILNDIKIINVESLLEIEIINTIAKKQNVVMDIALRINPSDMSSNAVYKMTGISSQFGIEEVYVDEIIKIIKNKLNVQLIGVQIYMGTQILSYKEIYNNTKKAIEKSLALAEKYQFPLKYINVGGGFGVPYFKGEEELDIICLKENLKNVFRKNNSNLRKTEVIFESGRYILANAGVMVVKILYEKKSRGVNYLICDGGSNIHSAAAFLGRYIRDNFPSRILNKNGDQKEVVITGPLCTPADVLGNHIKVSEHTTVGDHVVILNSGAYGLSYSPVNFLSHPLPRELLCDGEKIYQISGNFEKEWSL